MKESSILDSTKPRGLMSAEAACENTLAQSGDLVAPQQPGKKTETGDCSKGVPIPSTTSLILKAMYYWGISRG